MSSRFHAFMFPWFGFGHMTPFLHLANKLAEKHHKITFLLPKKALQQLQPLNLFPNNIIFHPLTIPPVNGLPFGSETASDIDISLAEFLTLAMNLTRDQVEAAIHDLEPDLIFFDLAYWVPEMAKECKVKSVSYNVISAASIAHALYTGTKGVSTLSRYPSSKVLLHEHDAYSRLFFTKTFYKILFDSITTGFLNCDVISLRTCQEVEGKFCDFIESQYQRKILLTGPLLPELDKTEALDDQWNSWLSKFEPGSVVFCVLGSQITLEKDQFQELCLGLELSGLPFLVAVKAPKGFSAVQEALPDGFEERVKGHGIVYGRWIQQPLILSHKSVGCVVNHCGFGSMWECLVSDCQIVLIPFLSDQVINTRLMSDELEVSVEVSREETGWFSKESLRDAIRSVMDKESEVGNVLKRNHAKIKESLMNSRVINGYIDEFVEVLENFININDE